MHIAVAEAESITSSAHWRHDAERRASAVLGQLHGRRRTRPDDACQELATIADDLLIGKKRALRLIEDSTTPILAVAVSARLARTVARILAKHIAAPAAAKLDATVAAIRAYGVLLCVLDNRNLTRCACLRALALAETEDRIRTEVREVLEGALQQLKLSISSKLQAN